MRYVGVFPIFRGCRIDNRLVCVYFGVFWSSLYFFSCEDELLAFVLLLLHRVTKDTHKLPY